MIEGSLVVERPTSSSRNSFLPFLPQLSLNGTVRYACPMIQKGIVVEQPPTTHQVKWLSQAIRGIS